MICTFFLQRIRKGKISPYTVLPSPLRELYVTFNYELSKQIVSVAFLRKIIRVNVLQTVRFLNGVGLTRSTKSKEEKKVLVPIIQSVDWRYIPDDNVSVSRRDSSVGKQSHSWSSRVTSNSRLSSVNPIASNSTSKKSPRSRVSSLSSASRTNLRQATVLLHIGFTSVPWSL